VSEDEIREFLDELVASRLVYRERDRYLALALPPRPREPRTSLVEASAS
jgi:hypothetical protein